MLHFERLEHAILLNSTEEKAFDVSVGPGNNEVILMKVFKRAVIQAGICHKKVLLGNEALKRIAMNNDFKLYRDKETQKIAVYKAWYDEGFIQYYKNSSNDLILEERAIFELENMQIDGRGNEKEVNVILGPGEELLIKINMVEEGKERKVSSKVADKTIKLIDRGGDDSQGTPTKIPGKTDTRKQDAGGMISSTGILSEKE